MANKFWGILASLPPQHWDCRPVPPHTCFYIDSEDSNIGLHVCVVSTLPDCTISSVSFVPDSYLLLVDLVINNFQSLFLYSLGCFFFPPNHVLERQYDIHVPWLGRRRKEPCALVIMLWWGTAKNSSPHVPLDYYEGGRVNGLAKVPALYDIGRSRWTDYGALGPWFLWVAGWRLNAVSPHFAPLQIPVGRFLFYLLEFQSEIVETYILKELINWEYIFLLQFSFS